MPSDSTQNILQITSRNNLATQMPGSDALADWVEAYFSLEVTTLESSQAVQRRDLGLFLDFLADELGSDDRRQWTSRLSSAFVRWLKQQLEENGARRWNDRTVNRIIAHLKTFAKWVHSLAPFPLGNPMAKVRAIPTASLLDLERALTDQERRRILDAADLLLETGGKSKDRHRYRGKERPRRSSYRPYRNRAIIYTLIETGMRRSAVTRINLADVSAKGYQLKVIEKGDVVQSYQISRQGMQAIDDYLEQERPGDAGQFASPALFLATGSRRSASSGRLSPRTINAIWRQVCDAAGVEGKTPHSARHAMGRHIMEKTGNAAAVARQLKHKNLSYSLQYSRVTADEMAQILNERD